MFENNWFANYNAMNVLLNNVKIRFLIFMICKSLDDDNKYNLAVAFTFFIMILSICILSDRLTWVN
jgi:hypothetical protein